MQFNRLNQLEASVLSTSNSSFETKPFSIPIPDETTQLQGYTIRPANGFTGYFYDESVKKEKIVLHFTAGHLKGDLLSLTSKKRGHVSAPFVLARDGKLFQLFSSAAWSYHLGRGAKGGNGTQSKKSIGIEISNFGPLTLKDGMLETIYSRIEGGPKHVYCSEADTSAYIKLDKPFRGYTYFASYTDEQYNALINLLRYLTKQYDIPREFLPEDVRYETTQEVVNFKGIVTHVNYRETGKWDMGPAFDWERVIKGVQGSSFSDSPTIHATPETLQTELTQAKEALAKAQARVDELEAKIQSASSGTTRGRGGHAASSGIMTSEEEVNKALEPPRTRGGRGRGVSNDDEPQELSLEKMMSYYLED